MTRRFRFTATVGTDSYTGERVLERAIVVFDVWKEVFFFRFKNAL